MVWVILGIIVFGALISIFKDKAEYNTLSQKDLSKYKWSYIDKTSGAYWIEDNKLFNDRRNLISEYLLKDYKDYHFYINKDQNKGTLYLKHIRIEFKLEDENKIRELTKIIDEAE